MEIILFQKGMHKLSPWVGWRRKQILLNFYSKINISKKERKQMNHYVLKRMIQLIPILDSFLTISLTMSAEPLKDMFLLKMFLLDII